MKKKMLSEEELNYKRKMLMYIFDLIFIVFLVIGLFCLFTMCFTFIKTMNAEEPVVQILSQFNLKYGG